MKKIILSILLTIPLFTISTFAINWDNDNFLDETFWAQSPTDNDIINALYGDGISFVDKTAYTNNWTGVTCDTGSMTVVYLNPGINIIPTTLNVNTIYVLNKGVYITTGIINTNNCSTIIGSGNVKLYSTTNLTYMIYNNNKQNVIIDNIKIDGYGNGNGGIHTTKNTYGIYLRGINNTINFIESINNASVGLYLYFGSYNIIHNSQFYNNYNHGLNIIGSKNTIIDNILSYNNKYGIGLDGLSENNTINNAQIFNGDYGLYIYHGRYNVFKNINIYNNRTNGIFIRGINSSYSIGNIFIDTNIYNNYVGILIQGTQSTGGVFYNTLNISNNSYDFQGTNLNDNYLKPGTGGFMGWNTGTVNTTPVSFNCDYVVWPNNFYLQGMCDQKGTINTYTNLTSYYKFGLNVPYQGTIVYYDTGNNLQYSLLSYDSNKNIGETKKTDYLGNVSINNSSQTTESNQIPVDLFVYNSGLNYTIFGDVDGSYNGVILGNNKTLTVTVSSGYGTKNISVQFFSGSETSPVYTKSITYVQLPDPSISIYYGNDSLYTKNREFNACDISQMSIQNINPGINTIPTMLSANTIYMLSSGTYITDITINMDTCSAIIGNGAVGLYSSTGIAYMIYSSGDNNIISNIQIDGYSNGNGGIHDIQTNYGIYLNSDNNTVYNVSSYNNSSYGLMLYDGTNNIVEGSQFFNNAGGGIYLIGGFNNKINNSLMFNNQRGIYITNDSEKNTIENSQIFNNNDGLYIYAGRYNLISNVLIYNQSYYGIYIRAINSSYCPGNIFVDTSSYNNAMGLVFDGNQSTGAVYYNTFKIFNNSSYNIGGTTLNDDYIKPGTGGLMGRSDGVFDIGTITLSSDYITNPKNIFGEFLVDLDATNRKGRKTRSGTTDIKYSFGNNLIKQNQAATYDFFYDIFQNIYYTNYGIIVYGNLSRNPIFPVGLNNFDLETYLQGNGYQKGTGSINTVSPTTLVGNSSIKGDYLKLYNDGKLSVPVVLQSTGTNPIEASIPTNTYIKNSLNEIFTGLVQAPIVKSIGGITGVPNVCSAISVGTYGGESVYFKDGNGNPTTVNVTMPVDACGGFVTGSNIGVYTREGTGPWTYITNATITTINDTKYITFGTTHFTDFAVGGEGTGTFVINNDASTTNTLEVELNMTMPMAISGMRFSNDGTTRSDREEFTGTKSRTLSDNIGIKTVYVAFDYDGDTIADIQISDSIIYDPNISGITQGQLSLEITGGVSECVYGTSLYLGEQDVKLNSGYTFTGSFSGQRYCADYVGISSGWVFTIGVSDLDNSNGGIISGSNLSISHGGAITQGDSACTGYDGAASEFYTTPYTLIEKAIDSNKICKVTLDSVDIEINVPANQAPGNYAGTLTIYVPNF